MKMNTHLRWAHDRFRAVLRPVIALQFWSTLVFIVSFVPAAGWLLNRLVASSGSYAVSDLDLLSFARSVPGLLFVLLGVAFALAYWFAEQAALLMVVLKAERGRRIAVSRVLWDNITRLPTLVRLGLRQALVYVLLAVPFVAGIALTYRLLLTDTDFYFYLNVQPPRWWVAVGIAAALAATYLALAAWLYVRWMLAVPAALFERATPRDALRTSWTRTRGRFRELALPLATVWIVVLVSGAVLTWIIGIIAARIMAGSQSLALLLPIVVTTFTLLAALDIAWFMAGKIMHVMVMTRMYLQAAEREDARVETLVNERPLPLGVIRAGWLAAFVIVVASGIFAGNVFLDRFEVDRTVEITGHRGSKRRAPENTLTAIRDAIQQDADFAEIDVQTTADGVVVLLHDADLMRVASDNRRLNAIDSETLRDIDVGSWFDPRFSDERVPTLQEVIDLARGRIRLNIEIKYTWDDPGLAGRVGRMIRENDFVSQCVVSSLNFPALTEIRRDFPEITTGLIVFQSVGNLSRMDADFLSLSAARATPRLVRAMHGRGGQVHVWTVNDPGTIVSMIEMGVDNIITDEPALVRRLLAEWNALSGREKLALMLRRLIVGHADPEPEEL